MMDTSIPKLWLMVITVAMISAMAHCEMERRDVDGDGAADIVYTDGAATLTWLSTKGGSLAGLALPNLPNVFREPLALRLVEQGKALDSVAGQAKLEIVQDGLKPSLHIESDHAGRVTIRPMTSTSGVSANGN
ncbi:MAG: hypothetical protein WCK47_04740 [bacterium]|nr:hypothetical protein [Candidatus Sumerlaeota bacterium]